MSAFSSQTESIAMAITSFEHRRTEILKNMEQRDNHIEELDKNKKDTLKVLERGAEGVESALPSNREVLALAVVFTDRLQTGSFTLITRFDEDIRKLEDANVQDRTALLQGKQELERICRKGLSISTYHS